MADKLIEKVCLQLGELLVQKKIHIAVAESCTGGMLSQYLTSISGSSAWFDCGFVTYSNESKMDLLGVNKDTLLNFGAVSKETALEMALGVLNKSRADISVSITGIAGPGGGSASRPVGTVFFAAAYQNKIIFDASKVFPGSRKNIRESSCLFALNQVLALTLNLQV